MTELCATETLQTSGKQITPSVSPLRRMGAYRDLFTSIKPGERKSAPPKRKPVEVTYYEILDRRACKCCGLSKLSCQVKSISITNHNASKVCIEDFKLSSWQRHSHLKSSEKTLLSTPTGPHEITA